MAITISRIDNATPSEKRRCMSWSSRLLVSSSHTVVGSTAMAPVSIRPRRPRIRRGAPEEHQRLDREGLFSYRNGTVTLFEGAGDDWLLVLHRRRKGCFAVIASSFLRRRVMTSPLFFFCQALRRREATAGPGRADPCHPWAHRRRRGGPAAGYESRWNPDRRHPTAVPVLRHSMYANRQGSAD